MLSLSEAIKTADPQQVEQLIQEGIDVNALCSNGKTPLALAVEQLLGYPSSLEGGLIVEQLLTAGAQIDSTDEKQQTLLHQLCKSISSSCVKHRFFGFYDDKKSVNIDQESQLRLIKTLLSYQLSLNNYDAEGHTPLFYALRDGHLALATLLMDASAALEISRQPGVSALHLACLHDWQGLVERMLDCGASIEIKDRQNQTPLDCSLKQGLWDMALLLIRRGATTSHVDWVNTFCHMQQGRRNQERHSGMLDYLMTQGIAKCKQPNGMTSLFHALDSPVLVKTLLAQGADPNAVCLLTGETPFLHAIRECSYSFHLEEETENTLFAVCDLLIAQGADPLVQDKQGQTALHYAVSGGITNQRTLQYLADHHIPLDVQDQQGQTALHIAMTNIHLMATALWLLQNHANPHIVDQAGQLPLEKITYQSIHSSSYLEKKSKELPILLKSFINALPANKILANGTDLLLFAVDLNNKELAQAILPHLTDINSLCQNTTALNLAIQKGFSEMVAWLIERGAQLNPRQESKNNPLSPLQQAVLSLNPIITEQLLDAGADPKVVGQNNRYLEQMLYRNWESTL